MNSRIEGRQINMVYQGIKFQFPFPYIFGCAVALSRQATCCSKSTELTKPGFLWICVLCLHFTWQDSQGGHISEGGCSAGLVRDLRYT